MSQIQACFELMAPSNLWWVVQIAEAPVGPKTCSQEGNSGQLPGVPRGGANLSMGDDL